MSIAGHNRREVAPTPRYEPAPGGQPAGPLQLNLVERLKAGRVVPVINDETVFDLVQGSRDRPTWHYTDGIRHSPPGTCRGTVKF